jgi:hypothetical protein
MAAVNQKSFDTPLLEEAKCNQLQSITHADT